MSLMLTFLSIVLGTLLSLALLYLFFWAAVYFFLPRTSLRINPAQKKKFAFVVPAHNEAEGIPETLESLSRVDYPKALFDVVVVADNCTDATAQIAWEAGAIVLERHSDSEKGKGYALKHAFQSLLPRGYEAFVVVDADSVVDRNFLTVMNTCLHSGYRVVQAEYGISNPEASPLTYLFQIGNILENALFYEGKRRLGLPSILRGNGMCFSREVLETHPWDAFSIVEDTEYAIKLIREGIDIPFAAETRVLARQPETLDQAHSQRVRWASGNMKMSKGYALKIMVEGIRKGNRSLIDAGMSLLVLSKPLLLLATLGMVVLSVINGMLFGAGKEPLYWALVLCATQFLYVMTGFLLGGVGWHKLKFLGKAPFYFAWMLGVTVLGMAGYKANSWVRTRRT